MKAISYFVVGLLIISSVAAISLGDAGEEQQLINLAFSNLEIENSVESYIEINIDGADGRLYHAGQPILPMHSELITLPFGATIADVECQVGNIHTEMLSEKIVPAPTPAVPGIESSQEAQYTMDQSVYGSNELFPDNWFDYYVGVGRDENNAHKTFLNVRTFPVRYNPVTNTVQYADSLEITVTYNNPTENPFPLTSEYSLVIIAPEKFESELQKLVTHKNAMGMSTLLKTTNDIYTEYDAYDKAEEIKYFIKDALETYDITYVLLVGGLDSIINGKPRDNDNIGAEDWWVPVRYTNNRESGETYDPGFISDLYYADIYKEGGVFDDWDSNDDGIYAKWSGISGKDILDLYPDVYVGRLACRNTNEVRVMVNKIINYEKAPAGSWYNTMIFAGGDSFDDTGTNYLEGELVCERISNDYMSEFTPVKLYASNKDTNPTMTPTGTNLKREITKGAGHLFLDGHASPATWTTHWPGEFEGADSWTERFYIFDFPMLWNFKKLPVCCVEGCHNSQFNVSMIPCWQDKDNSGHMWSYGTPLPECWSWWLARKIGGGTIATVGNTGLGYGAVGEHGDLDGDGLTEPDILEALGGYYFDKFYYVVDQGNDILGDCHSGAIKEYLDTFPGMDEQTDAKEMEQMVLLGDPSLKFGGYPSTAFRTTISEAEAGVIGAPSEYIVFQATSYNGQGQVTYAWDLDNDGQYDDATGETASRSWTLPGIYWIGVKATDESGNTDIFETIVSIEFGGDKPGVPVGETKVRLGIEYIYEASVNTQSGYWNKILYCFDWGDGTNTGWIESNYATHYWLGTGYYQIKVKVLLLHETSDGEESDCKETPWSDPLTIQLSRSRTRTNTIFDIMQEFFERYPRAFPVIRQLLGI